MVVLSVASAASARQLRTGCMHQPLGTRRRLASWIAVFPVSSKTTAVLASRTFQPTACQIPRVWRQDNGIARGVLPTMRAAPWIDLRVIKTEPDWHRLSEIVRAGANAGTARLHQSPTGRPTAKKSSARYECQGIVSRPEKLRVSGA